MKKNLIFLLVFVLAVTTGFWFTKLETSKTIIKPTQQKQPPPSTTTPAPEIKAKIPKLELMAPTVTIKLRNEPGTVNARRAAQIVNETILKPGEIFSYNKIVGERTLEKGFVVGSLPIKDVDGTIKNIKSVGSGICRLSVGLATAAKKNNLQQIEITRHEFTPYYFETNKDQNLVDATIYWGNGTEPLIDNKFKNNKNFDIQIKCDVDSDSILHVSFYKLIY